ncbi:MAG: hypothetical protein AAB250_03035, partial [Bdellovibrionota bacterium]
MRSSLRPSRRDGLVALGFLVSFLALFIRFPLNGLLPGNVDTVLGIALSNLLAENIRLFFTGGGGPLIFYPVESFMPYGENCVGLGILYSTLKVFARGDFWAYYLFLSILFTGSAVGVYKLASLFVEDTRVAVLAGVAFTLAGFTLANIDDSNVVFMFFPAMAFYFLERGRREARPGLIHLGLIFSGLQIWFGFYIFVFQALAIVLYFVTNARSLWPLLKGRHLSRTFLAYLLPALPLICLYLYYHFAVEPVSPYATYNEYIRQIGSLNWYHFWNVLPDVVVHSTKSNIYEAIDASVPSRLRKSCFPGFTFTVFTFLGVLAAARKHLWLAVVFGVFFALSFGVNLPLFETIARTHFGNYMRIPLRFHLFSLMIATIFYAVGVESRLGKWKKRGDLATLIA